MTHPGDRREKLREMSYEGYLKTPEWYTLRRLKLKQAEYTCELCGAEDTELHVHHRVYPQRGTEDLEDLQVLCAECHDKVHRPLEGGPEEPAAERNLMVALVFDPGLVEVALESGVTPDDLEHTPFRPLYRQLLHAKRSGSAIEDSLTADAADEYERVDSIRKNLKVNDLETARSMTEENVTVIQHRPHMRRMQAIDRALEDDDLDPERAVEMIQEKKEIAELLRDEGVPLSWALRVARDRAGGGQ